MKHIKSTNVYKPRVLWEWLTINDSPEVAVEMANVIAYACTPQFGGQTNPKAIYGYNDDGYPDQYEAAREEAALPADKQFGTSNGDKWLKKNGWKKLCTNDNIECWAKGDYAYAFSVGIGYTPSQIYCVVR